jgi:branched-chain amino acid transport system permease protein
MVIVGGLGSVLGSFFGAALILFAPILLNQAVGALATTSGLPISADLRAHLPLLLYGAMIMGFLLIEPLGLARSTTTPATTSWFGHSGTHRDENGRERPIG